MFQDNRFYIREYEASDKENVCAFLKKCLPESERTFEPEGVHESLLHIENEYDYFICLFQKESGLIIGTSALKRINAEKCELKCVYLYEKYHGRGFGTIMGRKVIEAAREKGYKEMYLDTISKTSSRAIKMYQRLGFKMTEKYHETIWSDIFMKMQL